jgi:hypothetical protein
MRDRRGLPPPIVMRSTKQSEVFWFMAATISKTMNVIDLQLVL